MEKEGSPPRPIPTPFRICVLVPVYNHGLTVQQVVHGAKASFPVIVVDDGSTDQTPSLLAAETGVTVLTLKPNQGKAAALKAGFVKAEGLGFTHAITIDADGQHPVSALGDMAAASRKSPEAFIIGVRNLKAARAPIARRLSNALSNQPQSIAQQRRFERRKERLDRLPTGRLRAGLVWWH